MAKNTEKPPVATTGHEWDGIVELNNPLPKWWVTVLYAWIVWGVVWIVLYPSIPGISGYFHGVLGWSSRKEVAAELKQTADKRAVLMNQIAKLPFDEIQKNPQLTEVALTDGRITFANNCQPCHGAGGQGRPGYPVLAGDSWIWGGSLGAIQQTVTYGVRNGNPDARSTQMPSFGQGILNATQIEQVADYVMTFYGYPVAGVDTSPGKALFNDNCAVCHGSNGQGNQSVGAPALKSAVHLYGSTRNDVIAQITNPRLGVMPNWNTRLDAATIKSVTLYVHSLGGGQ